MRLFVLLPLAFTGSALAEVKICNEYDDTVFVAAGSERDGTVRTMGWWEVAPGDCRVINSGAIVVPTYIHAQHESGNGGTVQRESWGTDRKLVVSRGVFTREHAERAKPGDVLEQFNDVTEGVAGRVGGVTVTIKQEGLAIVYTCGPGEHMAVRHVANPPREGVNCEK